MPLNTKNRFYFFGVPVDTVTMAEAIKIAEGMISSGKLNKIFTSNAEILLEASRDDGYRDILRSSDLSLPEAGPVLVGRLLFGMPFRERVPGVDFMIRLCELANIRNKKVFLLGGRSGVTERAAVVLKNKFPGIIISGYSEDEKTASQDSILLSSDILFVALGAKQQEKWICDFSFKPSNVRIAVAVGGSFDMISGDISRAPIFLRKMWLEWLWRFLMEPRKRWKRVINAVIVFPIYFLFRNKL